jgi:hypothetical protein
MQSAIYERSVQKRENPADVAAHKIVIFTCKHLMRRGNNIDRSC